MITKSFARFAAMESITRLRSCVFLGVMVLLSGSTALMGSSISCTSSGCSGNLGANANALVEVNFTANANTSLTVTTTSWDGSATPPGSCMICGFDPVLWLFDASMNQLTKNDDITLGTNKNAQITFGLTSGTMYELVLSASDQHWCVANTNCNNVVYSTNGWSNNGNFSGLTNGVFSFTFSPTGGAGTINSDFVTVDYPVAQGGRAAVPEPASLALLLTGGAFLTWRKLAKGR